LQTSEACLLNSRWGGSAVMAKAGSSGHKRCASDAKEDRFWLLLEENPDHYELIDQDDQQPRYLWDKV
jgi:hypothetical protein